MLCSIALGVSWSDLKPVANQKCLGCSVSVTHMLLLLHALIPCPCCIHVYTVLVSMIFALSSLHP